MEIILIIASAILLIVGLIGCFLPVLPGPFAAWFGLLAFYLTSVIPTPKVFLIVTFIISVAVFILDYIIPTLGTKKFGGTERGVKGSMIGLVIGAIFLGPLGLIFGPFLGALVGELTVNPSNTKKAFRAAFGSLVGFLASTFMKVAVVIIFMIFYIADFVTNFDNIKELF